MQKTKRLGRVLAIITGASMLALAGPAAIANDGNFGPGGGGNDHGNSNGNGNGHGATVDPSPSPAAGARDQASLDRVQARVDRAEQRAEVRAAGGTWGAVERQMTLLRVATRLAEHHAQVPTSAALGRILTLVNEGLPATLQIDIAAFLAQYDLIYADLVKARDEASDPSPNPSPSSSVEPLPEPSPSASA